MKSKEETESEWVNVGVTGFDDLLGKGIPKGTSVLISGGCGTGKTIFCLQTLWHGLTRGETCLYVSFEESKKRLIKHMHDFGWEPEKYLEEKKFHITRVDPLDISISIDGMLARKRGEISINIKEISGLIPKGVKPDRLVVDSLSSLASAFTGETAGYRIYISQLFRYFEEIDTTSFLISETEQTPKRYSREGVEEFLADGVFVFYNIRQGDIILRAIEVRKLRGASHKQRIVPFKIAGGEGVVVYPRENVFAEEKF